MADKLVIIPTYNERENIVRMIDTVLHLPGDFHILIVDDGSPDGTAQLVRQQQEKFTNRLFLLERSEKLGLGTAYIAGFRWGLEREYQYFFEMDCDFSHHPEDLIRLFEGLQQKGGDLAVGSRYIRGGKLENWPLSRILLSFGASLYVRMITLMPVKDPTAGFVCYTRRVLEKIDLDKIHFIGYAFQIEMKFASRQLGFHIVEIPITFTDRVEGSSKMSKGIVQEAILGVLQMRWRGFFSSYAFQ
ncbi:MAG: polyprenol monophosphomannose synthase [Saprospirales bacterium]|nr:polyprenol monophosphomannose synthase [Saprospirales bacterium]MBK8492362.1 polyprenol monophosphomannose synthase [Saprospirales bacterium]